MGDEPSKNNPNILKERTCKTRHIAKKLLFFNFAAISALEHEHPHCRKCALCSAHKVASPLYPLCRQNTHRAATAILICIQLYMLVTWRAEGTLQVVG